MSWPLTRTGTEAERWVVYPSGTPERRAGWCAQTWRQIWKHISIKITSGLKIQDPHNYSLFPLNLWEAQSDILSNKNKINKQLWTFIRNCLLVLAPATRTSARFWINWKMTCFIKSASRVVYWHSFTSVQFCCRVSHLFISSRWAKWKPEKLRRIMRQERVLGRRSGRDDDVMEVHCTVGNLLFPLLALIFIFPFICLSLRWTFWSFCDLHRDFILKYHLLVDPL